MGVNLSGNTITTGITYTSLFIKRVTRDGLSVYFDAGDANSYNGSGNWVDLSGNGNNCVWGTAPTWNSGGYFSFNGSSHYGTITYNQTSLDFSSGQTLIIVFRKSANASRQNPWNQAYGGYGTWTCETDGTVSNFFGDAGSDTTPYTNTTIAAATLNVWNIMAATRDSQKAFPYKNGVQGTIVNHAYGTLATTNINITIGNGYAGWFAGDIAMIIAYKRALNPYEVAEIFQALRYRFSL